MPFSIVVNGYPKNDVPVPHIQGSVLQGMFLHLISEVDPQIARRLHDEPGYRPYTLSPLGIERPTPNPSREGNRHPPGPPQGGNVFRGFKMPREQSIRSGSPCYLRITLLDDALFPTFSRYLQPERRSHRYAQHQKGAADWFYRGRGI